MSGLRKILVVDDGARSHDALSAELAELGFASVTASLDAADDIIQVMAPPAAILLQLPHRQSTAHRGKFLELAERLKAREGAARVPVILVDPASAFQAGGYAAMLQTEFGAHAVSRPEF